MKNNILFIYIRFFGYEKEILNTLKDLGYKTISFDERFSNKKFFKFIFRFLSKLILPINSIYFWLILLRLRKFKNIDYLLVLKGEVIPSWFIKKIHEIYPKIKSVYYTWDSFKNNPNGHKIFRLFSVAYSFDSVDCINYGLKLHPLFNAGTTRSEFIDQKKAGSVITLHSDRQKVLHEIIQILKTYGIETKYHIYSRVRIYDFVKSISRNFKNELKISSTPLTLSQTKSFLSECKYVIDVNHPDQNGLTMRSIEALSEKKKLITTNSNISSYIFYNSNNIQIIDRDNIRIDPAFFLTEFINNDNDNIQNLTLKNWIKEILSDGVYSWTIK